MFCVRNHYKQVQFYMLLARTKILLHWNLQLLISKVLLGEELVSDFTFLQLSPLAFCCFGEHVLARYICVFCSDPKGVGRFHYNAIRKPKKLWLSKLIHLCFRIMVIYCLYELQNPWIYLLSNINMNILALCCVMPGNNVIQQLH